MKGLASQEKQANDRLQAAIDFGPIRPIKSYLVHEFISINPRTGIMVYLELLHEFRNGTDRYNLYADGKKIGRQWSRWGFAQWVFGKVDPVRSDWD